MLIYNNRNITHVHSSCPFRQLIDIHCLATKVELPNYPYPPFPSFIPFLFLTCCVILPTSFLGKGPHLRRWLVAQPPSTVYYMTFSGFFLSGKVNARRFVYSPWYHLIITLSSADRHDTLGMWPLARNTVRSWWHRHTSLKLFFGQSQIQQVYTGW